MAVLLGCVPTEIIVVVDAEPNVRANLADLSVVIEDDRRPVEVWSLEELVRLGDGGLQWPIIVRVAQDGGERFRVEARATLGDGHVVSVSAAAEFVADERRLLRLVLREHCAGIVCAEGMTCVATPTCVDQSCCHSEEEVELVEYDPLAAIGDAGVVESCSNGRTDPGETGRDCGGTCAPCPVGDPCRVELDCRSGLCGVRESCLAQSCGNGVPDGNETDVDCGGGCDPCEAGSTCGLGADCVSGLCDVDRCAPVSCTNDVQDEGETDVDCGGPCPHCV